MERMDAKNDRERIWHVSPMLASRKEVDGRSTPINKQQTYNCGDQRVDHFRALRIHCTYYLQCDFLTLDCWTRREHTQWVLDLLPNSKLNHVLARSKPPPNVSSSSWTVHPNVGSDNQYYWPVCIPLFGISHPFCYWNLRHIRNTWG